MPSCCHRRAVIAISLGVDVRTGKAERLDVDLVELAIAALLRPLVPEHRARGPQLQPRAAQQAVGDRGAHDAGGGLRTQRQAVAAGVGEGVHLLLDDVGELADGALEQRRCARPPARASPRSHRRRTARARRARGAARRRSRRAARRSCRAPRQAGEPGSLGLGAGRRWLRGGVGYGLAGRAATAAPVRGPMRSRGSHGAAGARNCRPRRDRRAPARHARRPAAHPGDARPMAR